MPTESLTLQITADSAPLHRELEALERRLNDFANRIAQATDVSRSIDRLASRFTSLFQPIEQVGRLLDRITTQIANLANTPVQLNIAPALQGLAALSQSIDVIAAKLAALSAPRPALPIPFDLPQDPGPIRRFASGGYVTGPAGLDQVPAFLSAGEFVLRASAVRQIGTAVLTQLNHGQTLSPTPTPAPPPPTTSTSITNLGGVNLHVSQPVDLPTLVRNLHHQDARLRTRRG
jgi:hypothetical protein